MGDSILSAERNYPVIQSNLPAPAQPVSFICVRFSEEYNHNILKSDCIHAPLNQFITIDNRCNAFFDTLGQAINAGIEQAQHDLLVIVHEDVMLPTNWQNRFELSLSALEAHEDDWQVIGLVGWDADEKLIGHSSDPHAYRDTLRHKHFAQAARIDEQVLILKKSNGLFPDPDLPSIHNIGRDMAWRASKRNAGAYVINAPCIHKYADAGGDIIIQRSDSEKITHRSALTFIHNQECSDEYLAITHGLAQKDGGIVAPSLTKQQQKQLDAPIILIGRGGSGTRLMSQLASDIGLFIGNTNNPAGDCLEMVGPVYRSVFRKYQCPATWQSDLIVPDLRKAAADMLDEAGWVTPWAFKLPECLLILPELIAAFPNARFVFLERNPIKTVLRRTHMTSRPDNEIGRAALPQAYDFAGVPRDQIIGDDPTIRMARTTAHQLTSVLDVKASVPTDRWFDLNFESLLADPNQSLVAFAEFCGRSVQSREILNIVNADRADRPSTTFDADMVETVQSILNPIRRRMGYPRRDMT